MLFSFLTVTLIIVITIFIHLEESNKQTLPTLVKQESKDIILQTKDINPEIILEPSMQFIETMPSTVSQSTTTSVSIPILPPKNVATMQKIAPISPPAKIAQNVIIPPSLITPTIKSTTQPSSIKRDTATFDIHEIEDRFKNNSNPHLGLYIARYHYDHGNYNEAYNYALKTNSINNTIEESWLIFAKAMVKLGKTDQAKKTLQLYISQSNSDAARNLLDSFEKDVSK
ncbi:MAG: CDC27 family protein [Sulfuricurvum sp.]|nr:CDC27 family protein [Sulfuricurvum sp.]